MSHRICCYTLFDITRTGVMNRSKPDMDNIEDWVYKRNAQCNFDTILQVISLRSQPDVIKYPTKNIITIDDLDKFGFLFKYNSEIEQYYWKFEFEVHHSSVFENGIITMGALYDDCSGVPMIVFNKQSESLVSFLNTSDELKNIHFEVL
jgi:hypothetical protein